MDVGEGLEHEALTTSTPRLRATAMTLLSVPKSTPTTDMFIGGGGVSEQQEEETEGMRGRWL